MANNHYNHSMKIYFVRHGQTQYNIEKRFTGQADVPLTEGGKQQARDLARDLPLDFTMIYSSDRIRCKETAAILNEKLNAPVMYDERLRERNFGSLEGKFRADVDPAIIEKDKNQQYDYRPYGGESADDVKSRVFSFIADLQKNYKDKKILVVTSGGVIRLLHNVLNGEVHEIIHNAAIHEFNFE